MLRRGRADKIPKGGEVVSWFDIPGRTPDAEVVLKTVSHVIETAKRPVWPEWNKQEGNSIGKGVRKASVRQDTWAVVGHFNDFSFSPRK